MTTTCENCGRPRGTDKERRALPAQIGFAGVVWRLAGGFERAPEGSFTAAMFMAGARPRCWHGSDDLCRLYDEMEKADAQEEAQGAVAAS